MFSPRSSRRSGARSSHERNDLASPLLVNGSVQFAFVRRSIKAPCPQTGWGRLEIRFLGVAGNSGRVPRRRHTCIRLAGRRGHKRTVVGEQVSLFSAGGFEKPTVSLNAPQNNDVLAPGPVRRGVFRFVQRLRDRLVSKR